MLVRARPVTGSHHKRMTPPVLDNPNGHRDHSQVPKFII